MIFGTLGNAFVGEGADVIIGDPAGNLPFGLIMGAVLPRVQSGELPEADGGEITVVGRSPKGAGEGSDLNALADCLDKCKWEAAGAGLGLLGGVLWYGSWTSPGSATALAAGLGLSISGGVLVLGLGVAAVGLLALSFWMLRECLRTCEAAYG